MPAVLVQLGRARRRLTDVRLAARAARVRVGGGPVFGVFALMAWMVAVMLYAMVAAIVRQRR